MRHARLLRLFARTSLEIDLEYRANFVGTIVTSLFDLVWSVAAVFVLYSYTDSLGGWSFHESLVVIGMVYIAYGYVDSVVFPNTQELPEHVRKGTMDFILTKPLNSQFHAMFRRLRLDRMTSIVSGLALIGYALVQLRATPGLGQVALLLVAFVGVLLMLHSTMTLLASTAFWAVRTEGVTEMVYSIMEIARYPSSAFPEPLRAVITFVIPIAFISTVPAEIVLDRISPAAVVYGWGFALALFALSVVVWRRAVRQYGSASS